MTTDTIVVVVILCIFHSMFCVNCAIWTQFKTPEKYADKMCFANFVESEFSVANKLRCLATCSFQTKCKNLIYQRKHKICYRIRDGYRSRDCSIEYPGARLYTRQTCPAEWELVYRSCYRVTKDEQIAHRNVSQAMCKSYSKYAHLPDLQTEDKMKFVNRWLRNEKGLNNLLWLGATNDKDWLWSDGVPVTFSNWNTDQDPKYEGVPLCLAKSAGLAWLSQPCEAPLKNTGNWGMCELDIP